MLPLPEGVDDDKIEILAIGNRTVVAATRDGTIRRFRLGGVRAAIERPIDVPDRRVHRIFVDPSGSHVIFSTDAGRNFYLHADSLTPTAIRGMTGMHIESLAFDRGTLTPTNTGTVLVGTRIGKIFGIEGGDSIATELYDIGFPTSIGGLRMERYPPSKIYVMCTTARPTRVYEFVGGPNVSKLFYKYCSDDRRENFVELPCDFDRSHLCFFGKHRSNSFAVLSEAGIYHGSLRFGTKEKVSFDERLLLFSDSDCKIGVPHSMATTEFHFFLQYRDAIVAKNRLSEEIVFRQDIGSQSTPILGLVTDLATNEIWAYTASDMYLLHVVDERRDVWKLFLDRAWTKPRYFETALRHCQTEEERQIVTNTQAKYHFSSGAYGMAARYFARTRRPLEEIALIFVRARRWRALGLYLREKIKLLKDPVQRKVLCTWLLDIYLRCLASAESSSNKAESGALVDLVQSFIKSRSKELDRELTTKMLRRYGRDSLVLWYYEHMKEHDRVVAHLIARRQHREALAYISRRVEEERADEACISLVFKYAPSLFVSLPSETMDMWKRVFPSVLLTRFIPALVCYDAAWQRERGGDRTRRHHHGAEFVDFACRASSHGRKGSEAMHTYALRLYASLPEGHPQQHLVSIVENGTGSHITRPGNSPPPFDISFALRTCARLRDRADVQRATIHLHAANGNFVSAVQRALATKCVSLAKSIASRASVEASDDDARRLWLLIAEHVLGKSTSSMKYPQRIAVGLGLLKEASTLRLEDILKIIEKDRAIKTLDRHVRDAVCSVLRSNGVAKAEYADEVRKGLKRARNIRDDIERAANQCIRVGADASCCICGSPAHQKVFVVFPCGHVFHETCLCRARNAATAMDECLFCGSPMIDAVGDPLVESSIDGLPLN